MAPNDACQQRFLAGINAGDPDITQYQYNGSARGIYVGVANPPPFITVQGCEALCGTDAEYYQWSDISATISTWVLPVVGLLLQAPFESNVFWKTVFAMVHWLGSPISSLAAIFWNIKVFGKCSMIVDMATTYDHIPDEDSEFAQIRDSFYLLSIMNQFSFKHTIPRIEAEKLLRVTLFSDSLQLEVVEEDTRNLVKRRRKLAKALREGRKKGVVPVFISLLWFLFSLIISIQQAFGQLGYNATAHNLAMGLLLAWLPTFTLCSIVDRNPTQPDAVKAKLNKLVDAVRMALLNPDLRETYIKETGRPRPSFDWTASLNDDSYFQEDFFTTFAGQGRLRWHYGIAHGILAGIEENYVARHGRNWLRNYEEAATALVKGPQNMHGLAHEFDPKEAWQMFAAFLIVSTSIFGAFLISFWTPTIGLGCRSGGYMIFYIIACLCLGIELFCWHYVKPGTNLDEDALSRYATRVSRRMSKPGKENRLATWAKKFSWWWQSSRKRNLVEWFILRPLECCNTVWLAYIVMAQATGAYTTCGCECSVWGLGSSGYMDFNTQTYYLELGIGYVWGASTAFACIPMVAAFSYIVVEWCLQSHLSTVDYEKAKRGLMRTRRFRKLCLPIDRSLRLANNFVVWLWHKAAPRCMIRPRRSSVRWTHRPTFGPAFRLRFYSASANGADSAIDDRPIFHESNYQQERLGVSADTSRLASPSRSVNRSPRSSFGQDEIDPTNKPKSFV